MKPKRDKPTVLTKKRAKKESIKRGPQLMVDVLKRQLAEALDAQVSGFYGDHPPSFRQGAPTHELEEVVTVVDCVRWVAQIELLRKGGVETSSTGQIDTALQQLHGLRLRQIEQMERMAKLMAEMAEKIKALAPFKCSICG